MQVDDKNAVVLTERQKSILTLMISGMKNDSIAQELGISVNTVKYHKKVIFRQLGAVSASQATAIAFALELI